MSLEGILLGLLAIVIGLAWAFYGLKLFAILLPIWAFFFGLVAGAQWGVDIFGQRLLRDHPVVGHRDRLRARPRGDLVLLVLRRDRHPAAAPSATCSGVGFFDWLGLGPGVIAMHRRRSSSVRSSRSRRSCSGSRSSWSSSSPRSAARPQSSTACSSSSVGSRSRPSTRDLRLAPRERGRSASSSILVVGAAAIYWQIREVGVVDARRSTGAAYRYASVEPRSLVAAIDQGTTSSRCILFDRDGRPVASHQLEHAQITPRPGWVEHDADEILERVRTCIRVALRDSDADARALCGGRDQRPARDDGRLGSRGPGGRSTTPSSGRTREPPMPAPGWRPAIRRHRPLPGADGPADLDLLVGAQARLDPRGRAVASGGRGRGR